MLNVIEGELRDFGRPPKLSRADQLLVTLMYWREYRTQFHIAETYEVSEATVSRTIKKVEDALMRSGQLRLPGKKALQDSETSIEVIVVDAVILGNAFAEPAVAGDGDKVAAEGLTVEEVVVDAVVAAAFASDRHPLVNRVGVR